MRLLSNTRKAALAMVGTLALAFSATAQTAFAPAVVVNDDVITYYDIQQRALLLQMNGAPNNPGLNNASAEQLIDDRLRAQAGKDFRLSADEAEMQEALNEFGQRLGLDGAAFLARAQQMGIDRAAIDNLLNSQVLWRKLINGRFGSQATPSEVELDQEIALAASSQSSSYRINEIALPAGRGQEEEARATINRIMGELQRGASFSALARRYSRAPSAKNGGDVGWVPATVMPPELVSLIEQTPEGGVTPPFATPGGVSIFQVVDTRSEASPWAKSAEVSLQRIAVPVEGSEDEAMRTAQEMREQSRGCGNPPELTGSATMESIDRKLVNALPGPVRDAVNLLQAGQASAPVRSGNTVDIFIVCEKTGGVDDAARNQLREQIRADRLNRLADGYLQSLRREAVIEWR